MNFLVGICAEALPDAARGSSEFLGEFSVDFFFSKENNVKTNPQKIHTKIHLEIHLSLEATLRVIF